MVQSKKYRSGVLIADFICLLLLLVVICIDQVLEFHELAVHCSIVRDMFVSF